MAGLEIPDRYNVGADLLDRNLKAGRENKVAIHAAAGAIPSEKPSTRCENEVKRLVKE